MAQTVRLYPNADGPVSWSQSYGGCTHIDSATQTGYAPASGGGPDTTNYWEYVDDPVGSLDESDSVALFSKRDLTTSNESISGYIGFEMGPAPTNVSVLSVSLSAYLRASRQGAPDTVGWGLNSPLNVYGYVVGTSYTSTVAALDISSAAAYTRRDSSTPAGTYALYNLGTWATNPATAAAWTQADLVGIVAGIRITSMTEAITTASNEHVVEFASLYLTVTVEPTDSSVENPRKILSHQLRLKRDSVKKVSVTVPYTLGNLEPGDNVWSAVPVDPVPGEATESQVADYTEPADERPLFVTAVEIVPSPPSVRLEAYDLRDKYCTYWGTWRTDIGLTSDYSGIAIMDRGGGYTMNRAAAASGKDLMRRPNDFYFQEAIANKPRFGPYGLAVCGGQFGASRGQAAYTANNGESSYYGSYNTFSGGTGTTFTGWTNDKTGTGATYELTTPFIDITGYRRGARIVHGSPANLNLSYMYQSLGSWSSSYSPRIFFRFTTASDDLAKSALFILRRADITNDWNPADDTFGGAAWRATTSGNSNVLYKYQAGSGPAHYEYWSRPVTIPATANYTLFFGYSQTANSSVDWHAAGVVGAGTGSFYRPLRREFSANAASVVTPYADEYSLYNGSQNRIWEADRGFVSFQFTPMWDHEDLTDGADKYLLTAYHDDSNNDYEVLYYHRTNSTTGYYRFQRYYGGSDAGYATFATSGSTLPNYMEPVPVAIRWTGSYGELGLGPYTLDLFIDGVKGTAAVATNKCRQEGDGTTSDIAPNVYIGHYPKTTTKAPHSFADGYFADFEIRNCVPSNQEVFLLHSKYTMAGLPTLVS